MFTRNGDLLNMFIDQLSSKRIQNTQIKLSKKESPLSIQCPISMRRFSFYELKIIDIKVSLGMKIFLLNLHSRRKIHTVWHKHDDLNHDEENNDEIKRGWDLRRHCSLPSSFRMVTWPNICSKGIREEISSGNYWTFMIFHPSFPLDFANIKPRGLDVKKCFNF